jgi:DNA-directed RNA polymerase specialized sigma24 family protein
MMGKKAGRDCLDAFLRQGGYERLRAYVARRFPRLADRADDLIQIALTELLEKEKDEPVEPWTPSSEVIQEGYGDRSAPEADRPWLPSLMKRIEGRALDALRRVEHVALSALAQDEEGAGDALSPRSDAAAVDPAVYAEEAERREEQVALLSDILREFVAWCEAPSRKGGTRMKELYERRVRGQEPGQIAAAMGMSRNAVDQTLKRAREWILDRIRQKDAHQSIFRTLLRGCPPRPIDVSVPLVGVRAVFHSFEDVLRFVVDDIGALCPSAERMENYWRNPSEEECADIRYHVQECRCRHCCERE